MDVKGNDGKRIPYWVDILGLMIDEKEVLSKPVCVWHDKPYRYEIPVKDGQKISCVLTFKPHGVGKQIQEVGRKEKAKWEQKAFLNMISARMELKNAGTSSQNLLDFIELNGNHAVVQNAPWLTDEKGQGYIIRSAAKQMKTGLLQGKMSVKCHCVGDGNLKIVLRGMDVKGADGKRIPYWVDIIDLMIDGKEVLSKPVCVWHDKPYRYKIPVKDRQEIEIMMIFRPIGVGNKALDLTAQEKTSNPGDGSKRLEKKEPAKTKETTESKEVSDDRKKSKAQHSRKLKTLVRRAKKLLPFRR